MVAQTLQTTASQNTESQSHSTDNTMNILAYALYMMFDAIDTRREQVKAELSNLNESAKVQHDLNAQISAITYENFPDDDKKATPEEIDRINAYNAQRNTIKSNIEDRIMTFRQEAKVSMTRTQASISAEQTYAAQASNSLKVQNDVTKKTVQMNDRVN